LSLDTTKARPVVRLSLVSPLIQLADFASGEPVADRQLAQQSAADPAEAATDGAQQDASAASSAEPAEPAVRLRDLLSYEVLNRLDASVSLEAGQVLSGKDQLGAAHMHLTLEDARLAIDPLQVDIPGGGVNSSLSYHARPNDASLSLAADIEQLDLGILFRRAKPDTDRGGVITLSARLDATAPNLEDMMANASGHLDYRLIPENFTAAVWDLWAVNLVSTVLKEVSEEEKSKINCLVVRLRMAEGVMRERAIYMDTSKMRIVGQADLDFRKRTLKLLMKPKAKKAKLFSLTTPILVQGSFDDFGVRGVVLGLVSSAVSFVTSPIHAPLRRVFTEKQPPDGLQACEEAWKRTGDESWTTGRIPTDDSGSANP
jgi:uncharacterized protein involved in outer membrane biogenesis